MATEIIPTTPDCEIISSRIFNAPRELVFRAWADPNHLKNWWGPAGFTNIFNEFDFRIGGRWSFIMHGPDKGNYPNECEFIKIKEPSLIAWKRFSKPLFQVVATFEEAPENKTLLVFKMLFDTARECEKVKAFAVDKNEENFDKLAHELIIMASQSFYHGTKANLKRGDLIEPGFNSNYGQRNKAKYVYLSATLDAAIWGAELAFGEAIGRVYSVEPTGLIEDDPNLTDKKFPGNPTKSYRTKSALKVVDEVVDWQGHSPEQLKQMKDHLEQLKQQGIEAIED